jgi:hypothetical protein
MKKGGSLLVIAHPFPFALARVAGPCNCIRRAQPYIGVWFRPFHEVLDVMTRPQGHQYS